MRDASAVASGRPLRAVSSWRLLRLVISVLALLALAGTRHAVRAQAPAQAAAQERHVVIISIDGLKPATYTTPGPAKIPTLRRLAQEGVWADGVV